MSDVTPLDLYQRAEIEAGLAQANLGEFATDEQVAAVLATFGVAWDPNATNHDRSADRAKTYCAKGIYCILLRAF